ncbi:Hint domain-containing protein [Rhodobacter sp. Har01]|uniref:Hint domain-containing protein n=1 Tax=Rhodobacter sp. Har01 TaxID=2883999 RepID=UPI001D08EA11|nr:Hint domain-containing protein [Rhodobacter sp. Har01]MCB6177361.1 Hint domain-containing protein [Rhodobacter sp. Har01]
MTAESSASLPGHACQVFAAEDFFVTAGVNAGDALGLPDSAETGDVYALDDAARPLRLVLSRTAPSNNPTVAEGSGIGQAGDRVGLIAAYTLMSPDGDPVELMVLSVSGRLCALPLSPVSGRTDYTLLRIETAPERARLIDLMALSFARGTRITLATGLQVPIEELRPGDKVLTRDHGAQPLRFIGRATLRATGAFAPAVIPPGVLGNSGTLIVSQQHRMFLYQRRRLPGLPSAELLVQARYLVDHETVFIREGGFVDWFSLVFDRHEIIYAEGIPAESLMVNDATVSRLPPEIAAEVERQFPGLAQVQHFGTEAGRQFLESIGPAALYQPASAVRTRGRADRKP